MDEKIKEIIASYLGLPADSLSMNTAIGRAAGINSILQHRMFAALAKEGLVIHNMHDIKTISDLFNKAPRDGNDMETSHALELYRGTVGHNRTGAGIGIDIEETSQMPVVADFREDEFYKMNFAPEEISYCVLQADPVISLTGLFAAKEAIVKADNNYNQVPFKKIFIDHLPEGQPVFNGFKLTISHTSHLAVAVAIKDAVNNIDAVVRQQENPVHHSFRWTTFISIVALLIAIAAFWISLSS
jgi:phosphopantetheine--protein transferase-like protein